MLARVSPLIYPGGSPRFNSRHPAARNCALCAAAGTQGNILDLISGAPGVIVPGTLPNNPGAAIDGLIGPAITNPHKSGSSCVSHLSGAANSWGNSFTLAGIFRPILSNPSLYPYSSQYLIATASSPYVQLWAAGSAAPIYYNFNLGYGASPSPSLGGGVTVFDKVPVFIAVSGTWDGIQTYTYDSIVRRLDNGQLFSAMGSTSNNSNNNFAAINLTGRVFNVGTQSIDYNPYTNTAAAMFSLTRLSFDDLLKWADDPWEFWYPHTTPLMIPGVGGLTGAVYSASVTENSVLSDVASDTLVLTVSAEDAASVTDLLSSLATLVSATNEQLSATDASNNNLIVQSITSELAQAIDQSTSTSISVASVAEAAQIIDQASSQMTMVSFSIEIASVADAMQVLAELSAALSESNLVADSVFSQIGGNPPTRMNVTVLSPRSRTQVQKGKPSSIVLAPSIRTTITEG